MGKKTRTGKPGLLVSAVLLAGAVLLTGGLFAGCGGKKEAATMHLVQTAGTVGVQDEKEKEVSLVENLGLYSGYQVGTRAESYAWIDLDQVKLAKMDQDSGIEIQKSENGKDLKIHVQSGSMFFNVKEPLAKDESMEIQTSTMIAGIRGTCGWMERGEDFSRFGLLEGTVECQAAGGGSVLLSAGQTAFLPDDGTEILVSHLEAAEIPDFVRQEVPELVEQLAMAEHAEETEPETEAEEEVLFDSEAGLELVEQPQDGIERRVLEVTDSEALTELVMNEDLSNTEIRLGDGTYDVSRFHLYGCENLSIIGTGNTRLVVNNGYELILEAVNCKNLLLYGLVMGHELSPEESGCTAGVVCLYTCEDVKLVNCDIYGCGLVGLSGMNSSITAQNTVIRDCSQCAVYWMGGTGELRFENCAFSGNGMDPLFTGNAEETVFTLENCIMQDNRSIEKYNFYIEAPGAWNETGTREAGNGWQSS